MKTFGVCRIWINFLYFCSWNFTSFAINSKLELTNVLGCHFAFIEGLNESRTNIWIYFFSCFATDLETSHLDHSFHQLMSDTVKQLITVIFGTAIERGNWIIWLISCSNFTQCKQIFFLIFASNNHTHLNPMKCLMYRPGGTSDFQAPKITLCKWSPISLTSLLTFIIKL